MKRKTHISLLLAGLMLGMLLPGNSSAQVNWDEYTGNPVLEGKIQSWYSAIYFPVVLHEEGIFKMWFAGYSPTSSRIGYAESPDEVNWVMNESWVVDPGVGTWHANKFPGSVYRHNDTLRMWFAATEDWVEWKIGYAWSVNDNEWNIYPEPVLEGGQAWDLYGVSSPSVCFNEGFYHMYYSGHDGTRSTIGYAISYDGIYWNKYVDNPVISTGPPGTWYDADLYASTPICFGDTIRMFFTAFDAESTIPEGYWRVGYAYSLDQFNWFWGSTNGLLPSPVLNIGEPGSWDCYGVGPACVMVDDHQYKMWYGGQNEESYGIGYASGDAEFHEICSDFAVGVSEIFFPTTVCLRLSPSTFRNSVNIEYEISKKTHVQLLLYNLSGQLVESLADHDIGPGLHTLSFDGSNLPAGMYFCVLQTNKDRVARKIVKAE